MNSNNNPWIIDYRSKEQLENITFLVNQVKQLWENIIEQLSIKDEENLILKLIILTTHLKDNNETKITSNQIAKKYNIDLKESSSFFKVNHWLFWYENKNWNFQYISITPDWDINKFSYEFDEKIKFISEDWNNLDHIFEWIISWEKSLFEIDKENKYITYLLRENFILEVSSTPLENILKITYKKPWNSLTVDVISKYENSELFSIINEWYSNIQIGINWLTICENVAEKKYYIWVIENSQFTLLKDVHKISQINNIEFNETDPNTKSCVILYDWSKSSSYIFDIVNAKFENIPNWDLINFLDIESVNLDYFIDFLKWNKNIIYDKKIIAFDPVNNILVVLKKLDKKSSIYIKNDTVYFPKKWFRFVNWKIYKKSLIKNKLIKDLEPDNSDDLDNYFENISLTN